MRKINRFDRHTITLANDSSRKMVERLRNAGWGRNCKYRELCDIQAGHTKLNGEKLTLANSFYGKKVLQLENLRSTAYSMYDSKGKGKTIVDAGCGRSPDAYIAVEQDGFSKGYRIDLLPFATKDDGKVVNILGDICENWKGIKINSVDVVICQAVLDLMDAPDRDLFYKQAFKYLKKGGVLVAYFVHLSAGWGYDFSDEQTAVEDVGFQISQIMTSSAFKAIKL